MEFFKVLNALIVGIFLLLVAGGLYMLDYVLIGDFDYGMTPYGMFITEVPLFEFFSDIIDLDNDISITLTNVGRFIFRTGAIIIGLTGIWKTIVSGYKLITIEK